MAASDIRLAPNGPTGEGSVEESGESARWTCNGLNGEGIFVLKRALPKTWQQAALEYVQTRWQT